MSTKMFEVISLVYGKEIIRFAGVASTISAALGPDRIVACGLSTATRARLAHSRPIRSRCSSRLRPAAPRRALSNSG